MSNFEDKSFAIGSFLSVLCCVMVITTWCLFPKWRNLHNYISMNQIITGTLHLLNCSFSEEILGWFTETETAYNYAVFLNGYFFLATMSWSFCCSLLAYLRLVLLQSRKISYEKRKATAVTLWTLVIVRVTCDYIVPTICRLTFDEQLMLSIYACTMIMTINLLIFVRIAFSVMSCCKKSISRRNLKHVTSVIGVALVCDSIVIGYFIIFIVGLSIPWIFNIGIICFTMRLVPQTLLLLLKPTSRKHWRNLLRNRNFFLNHEMSTFHQTRLVDFLN